MKSEGLRGLYKAYGATVLSFGPFSGLYFMFYETVKSWMMNYNCYRLVKQQGDSGEDVKPAVGLGFF